MAAILNIPPSTVQSWKYAGVIPARRQAEVLDAARREGVVLTHADFFEATNVYVTEGRETARRLRDLADDIEQGNVHPIPVVGKIS